jgi:glucan phosphoethanolaminetransferase (alkaline phosphatase superfamily)
MSTRARFPLANSAIAVPCSKVFAIAALILLAPWGWWGNVIHEVDWMLWFRSWTLIAVYLTAFAISLAGLCVLPFLGDWRLRVPLAIVLFTGLAADQIVLGVSGHHITAEMIAIGVREKALAGGFLRNFEATIINKLLLVCVVAVPFLIPPGKRWRIPSRTVCIPLSGFVLVAVLLKSENKGMDALPAPYFVPAQIVTSHVLSPAEAAVQRRRVDYADGVRPLARKVVMVVDESVRGDYLGLNNPQYSNTPSLSGAAEELANYGIAISGANCSAISRLMLRVGLQKNQIPDQREVWRELPTIWQYAADANVRTVFIDSWNRFGTFHSFMNTQEALQITEFVTVLDFPYYRRDLAIADKLVELLRRDEPMLIYVNKYGTHMPYRDNFPPDISYDSSALVKSLSFNENRREAIRDYHKAIKWSVDNFFARVLPAIGDDAVLIYTSDHGQALFEGNYDVGHCSGQPHHTEVYVPLFVATGSPSLRARFKTAAKRAYNSATHFEIFPTLLEVLGYSKAWIQTKYGPSLLDVPLDRQPSFVLGGFTGRLVNVPPPVDRRGLH